MCSGLKGLRSGAAQLQSQARYVHGADANCNMQYTGDGRQRQELCSHDRYSWEGRKEGRRLVLEDVELIGDQKNGL